MLNYIPNSDSALLKSTTIASLEDFLTLQDRCKRIYNSYADYTEEAAGSILTSTFIASVDGLLGLVNTMKTNMFKFYKGFKRSELRYYYSSNMLRCKTAYKADFTDCYKLNAAIPAGFKGNYVKSIASILKLYQAADLENSIASANTVFNQVLVAVTRNAVQPDIVAVKGLNQALAIRTEILEKAKKECDVFFANKPEESSIFGSVYENMQEFQTASNTLLDMETYLQNIHGLYNQLTMCGSTLQNIISSISKNNTKISKEFAKETSECIRRLAVGYDIYGQAAVRQSALEHNQIYTINTVYKAYIAQA